MRLMKFANTHIFVVESDTLNNTDIPVQSNLNIATEFSTVGNGRINATVAKRGLIVFIVAFLLRSLGTDIQVSRYSGFNFHCWRL